MNSVALGSLVYTGRTTRWIEEFLDLVGAAVLRAMARVMPYRSRTSRPGRPPLSKTGRLVKSLRVVRQPGRFTIHVVRYGHILQFSKNRPFIIPALLLVLPQLPRLAAIALARSFRSVS